MAGLAGAAAAWSVCGAHMAGVGLLARFSGDTWFDADVSRVLADMALTRESAGYRSTVHPLFSLLTVPGVRLLQALGASIEHATGIIIASVAALWAASLFAVLRRLGCRQFDAALFTLLGITSAAAIFWFPVRETYPLGSLGILVAIALVASTPSRRWPWIVASAATLAVTITNWMVALLGAALLLPIRRGVQVTLAALVLVGGLWVIQKQIVPGSAFFVPNRGEAKYMEAGTASRARRVATVLLIHSIVAPRVDILRADSFPLPLVRRDRRSPDQLSIQHAGLGSAGFGSVAATAAWLGLLGWGVIRSARWDQERRIWLVVLGSVGGQFALHVLYGRETFLYAMHWAPLLVILAAGTTLTPWRPLALALASIVLLAGGAGNLAQFRRAAGLFGLERYQVEREIQRRPHDPWPRTTGHVIMAPPGTEEHRKSYHEPGGGLSPVPGSFGVALWVTDEEGRLLTTSERIQLDSISQTYSSKPATAVPAIRTRTPYYDAEWSRDSDSSLWHLDLHPRTAPGRRLELVIRSVGPAGGPVHSIAWTGGRLRIEDTWTVVVTPGPERVAVGHEGDTAWRGTPAGAQTWNGEDGWGYARLQLPRARVRVTITSDVITKGETALAPLVPQPELRLPDPRFAASVRAAVDNLTMSLVGDEPRPADPLYTPVPEARSSAYIAVALARAGQLPIAKRLASFLARSDFYGPHGAEADAPGLGIWALVEIAEQVNDTTYARQLWPDVHRKAGLIEDQITAMDTLRAAPLNTPVPEDREIDPTVVAAPSQAGLIVGRLGRRWAPLYTTGIAVLGLERAAELGTLVGAVEDARRLRARARRLQADWLAASRSPGPHDLDDLSAAVRAAGLAGSAEALDSLVPTVERHRASRSDSLDGHADPGSHSFAIAGAHGWLLRGNPGSSWQTLLWFWDHQESPGLYTWARSDREADTYGWWDYVRCWVDPHEVTPDYEIAAQILLLQLDMLAVLKRSPEPTLVVGAGVPAAWIDSSFAVRDLQVAGRSIDWCWDGTRMEVSLRGAPLPVQLGAGFPRSATATLKVHHGPGLNCRV